MFERFVFWVHGRPELVRVGITASIGTVLAWITYEIVYALNSLEPRATTSWIFAFVIGIFRQHHLHRNLSFPNNQNTYLVSLSREVWSSFWLLSFSAGLNYLVVSIIQLHHRTAWILCLMTVAALEYALMKFYVFRRKPGSKR